jgi:hypothetical protein
MWMSGNFLDFNEHFSFCEEGEKENNRKLGSTFSPTLFSFGGYKKL